MMDQEIPYAVVLFWSDEDEAYIADIPDLEYCSAHGRTPEEALKEVKVAIRGVLASLRDHGDPIPSPRFRPDLARASA